MSGDIWITPSSHEPIAQVRGVAAAPDADRLELEVQRRGWDAIGRGGHELSGG